MLAEIEPEKKLIVISHCILNQNSVVHGWERAKGAYPFVLNLLKQGYSFIQLPCPEFLILGGERGPMSYDDYNGLPRFREKCKEMLQPIIQQIVMYLEEGYEYIGVIGINESPNCSISEKRGVLMEEYFSYCKENDISEHFVEVPTWYSSENEGNFGNVIQQFLGDVK